MFFFEKHINGFICNIWLQQSARRTKEICFLQHWQRQWTLKLTPVTTQHDTPLQSTSSLDFGHYTRHDASRHSRSGWSVCWLPVSPSLPPCCMYKVCELHPVVGWQSLLVWGAVLFTMMVCCCLVGWSCSPEWGWHICRSEQTDRWAYEVKGPWSSFRLELLHRDMGRRFFNAGVFFFEASIGRGPVVGLWKWGGRDGESFQSAVNGFDYF